MPDAADSSAKRRYPVIVPSDGGSGCPA